MGMSGSDFIDWRSAPILLHPFHLPDGHRFIFAEPACSVGSDQVVFFVTDATETFPGFQFVVLDKFAEPFFTSPIVDELRNKIDAGFYGKDKTGFQGAGQTERFETELCTFGLSVISYPYLD